MYAAERATPRLRIAMDARCPGAWAGAAHRRATQRVHRDLDRPARVLAVAEAHQGETGLAERGTFATGKRLRFNAIAKRHRNSWSAFARITPELSCERV